MTVVYEHDGVTVILGDAREKLASMIPDESVQCVVTSPPYYGLRSYFPDAVMMRDDLTHEEREYVEREMAALNIHPISEVI